MDNKDMRNKTLEERRESWMKGTVTLEKPFTIGTDTYDHLDYDFNTINMWNLIDALDSDPSNAFMTRISVRQAVTLFAYGCAVPMKIDPEDVLKNLTTVDTINARMIATNFFITTARVAQKKFSNE